LTDTEVITLALYIASIRYDDPDLCMALEHLLYDAISARYPESTVQYILELTDLQVYN
jgi:hypothetical protein